MRKLINKLRQKPPHVRDQIAIFSALTFAGLVGFIWMASLTREYASPETRASYNESFSPFRMFGNNVKNALDRSKAQLSEIDPENVGKSTDSTAITVDGSGVVNLGSSTETIKE
jgi:hypothetical protein